MKNIVTKGRKSLASAALAIGIALGFASPAQAETVTYSCEGESGGGGQTAQRTWTVDIDFSASKLKIADWPFLVAVITDREITFNSQDTIDPHQVKGRIDRLAGTMSYETSYLYPGYTNRVNHVFNQGRCRRATTKI